eukprot:scaffold4730_cov109-Isochrysis_galbana.AAC.10
MGRQQRDGCACAQSVGMIVLAGLSLGDKVDDETAVASSSGHAARYWRSVATADGGCIRCTLRDVTHPRDPVPREAPSLEPSQS